MPSSIDLAARLSAVVALQQDVLTASSDLGRVTQLIVSRTAELTNGEGAAFELLDGEDIYVAAAAGVVPFAVADRVPITGTIAVEALRSGEVVRRGDIRMEDASGKQTIRSSMTGPLVRDGMVIGVIESYSLVADAFADLDLYTLQLLGGIASAALLLAHEFEARRASEERYRMLFDRNVAGVFRTTRDGRILDCNDAFVGTFGYASRDELVSRDSWALYSHRDDRKAFLDRLEAERTIRNHRVHLKRKDGSPLVGTVNVSLIPGDGGEWQLLGTFVEDGKA